MEIEREDIAIRLAEERGRIGFSHRDFASKTGISAEGLRLYELGQRGISAEFLAKAAFWGVDVQYVLTGIRSQNQSDIDKSAHPSITVNDSTNVIGVVQNGATVNQIKTERHITTVKAVPKPGDEHISQQQAATLTALVNEIVELEAKLKKQPKTHRAVWGALNAYMSVTRYLLIPAVGFEKAEKYLRQWLGRLNSMASAPKKDNDEWRKRKYAYIKINSKNDAEAINAYLLKNFAVTSLTELSNDELDKVYRYVASRKNKK